MDRGKRHDPAEHYNAIPLWHDAGDLASNTGRPKEIKQCVAQNMLPYGESVLGSTYGKVDSTTPTFGSVLFSGYHFWGWF